MKNKKVVQIILVIMLVTSVGIFTGWKSELTRNNRYLDDKLAKDTLKSSGVVGDLFDFAYDELYVFRPYQSKDEMKKQIGFKTRVLQVTVNENMMNFLFVKDGSPVAYLYGYGSNKGYYIELPPGNYAKSEMEKGSYEVKTNMVGNSSGPEKTYQNYVIKF